MAKDIIKKLMGVVDNQYMDTMDKSVIFNRDEEFIPTEIPALNVALSSKIDNGLTPGITTIAGESRRYKTLFGLNLVKAFQNKYPDGICLFYDSEGGSPRRYIEQVGINREKVVHIPINCVEELKQKVTQQIDVLKNEKDDFKIMMFVDSIGNLASRKEIEDALSGSEKTDMTRAKSLKSFYRIISSDIKLLNIPFVNVNHTYKTQDFIPQDVVSGGQGGILNSDTILIINRAQKKEKGVLKGYDFKIKIDKSRYVIEKSIFPITVYYEDGIHKYSGMAEIAEKLEIIEKIKIGRSNGYKFNEREVLQKDVDIDTEFWNDVFENSDIKEKVHNKYKI